MSDEYWNRQLARLEGELVFLADKPEEDPLSSLKTLWLTARGEPCSVQEAVVRSRGELGEEGQERLEGLIERRLAGEPLAYITGRQSFMGVEFIASKEAMIPRKETELLARTALELMGVMGSERQDLRVIDVCTGSGNLPVSFALKHSGVRISGADLSPEAVQLARKNAALHGVAERVDFQQGDLLEPFAQEEYFGEVDILTCNPPYISSGGLKEVAAEITDHEPEMAFAAGAFGVEIINRLVEAAPKFLRPRTGVLCFEVGAGQGPFFIKRLQKKGSFKDVSGITDANDEIRVIKAAV